MVIFEIFGRQGPGDSFQYIMDVPGLSAYDALRMYAKNAGGALTHNNFLVGVKGHRRYWMFKMDPIPSFMEI